MENLILKAFEPIIQYVLSNAKDIELMIITSLLFVIILILQKHRYDKKISALCNIVLKCDRFLEKVDNSLKIQEERMPFIEKSIKSLLEEREQLKNLIQEKNAHIKYLKKNK